MSITDEQRKLISDLVEAELERRSLSPETQAEDTKRRVLDIMEEANDPATFVGTKAHNWLVRNLDFLRPRTEHYVTRFIYATGRMFVHHKLLFGVLGLLVLLGTAGITQMQHFLFALDKDKIVKRVLAAPEIQQELDEAIQQKKVNIATMEGEIKQVKKNILSQKSTVDDFTTRLEGLYGRLSDLEHLATKAEDAAQTVSAQANATAVAALDEAESQADKLGKELFQIIFRPDEEGSTCKNTANSLCVESTTCPPRTTTGASIRLSSDAAESSEFKLCVRDQTGNK